MSAGRMRCNFFTGLDRESRSSSSSSSSSVGVGFAVADRVVYLRQTFFGFPSRDSPVSGLRSHARGILVTGREAGSKEAASVSCRAGSKGAVARLRGESAMEAPADKSYSRSRIG